MPTPGGAGVFLQAGEKAITIFIDPMVARALRLGLNGEETPRPLTHDLMLSAFAGLGVDVDKVAVTHFEDETFFARLFLRQENELGESHIEIDARPSDCLVLASHCAAPIFVARKVWEEAEDMTWALDEMDPE